MYRLAVLCYCATWAGDGDLVQVASVQKVRPEFNFLVPRKAESCRCRSLCPSCCQYVGSIAQQAHSELYNQAEKHPQLFFCAPTAYWMEAGGGGGAGCRRGRRLWPSGGGHSIGNGWKHLIQQKICIGYDDLVMCAQFSHLKSGKILKTLKVNSKSIYY